MEYRAVFDRGEPPAHPCSGLSRRSTSQRGVDGTLLLKRRYEPVRGSRRWGWCEEQAMRGHRRQRAKNKCYATSICPVGYSGVEPPTAWGLLGNERALPAWRRLVSGSTALLARPYPLLGPAPNEST